MYEEQYIAQLIDLLGGLIRNQRRQIDEAAEIIAHSIMHDGVVHVFGTGHSSLIAMEPFMRAGGMLPVDALLDERVLLSGGALQSGINEKQEGLAAQILSAHQIQPNDSGIVISNSGRNAAPIQMALEMKKAGLRVIAITSLRHSDAVESSFSGGQKLKNVADLVLDNYAPYGDALMSLPGLDTAVGAVSTVTGAALINSIFILAAEKMLSQSIEPVVLPSGNLAVADYTRIQTAMEKYVGRIKYL
jgi:uncharacterized phosphosugar-binding protein